MGGGIDPLGLIDPWIRYQILKIKKKLIKRNKAGDARM